MVMNFTVLMTFFSQSYAQNLVPNSSFEVYSMCPVGLGMGGALQCNPWLSPFNTSDYFNGCADPTFCGVPANFQGYQPAHTGFAYTGMYFWIQGSYYREYIQVQLLQPLQADSCYMIGFYLNLANKGCGCNHASALVSVGQPPLNPAPAPQLDWSGEFFSDTVNWIYVLGYFIANGGENYITIGNFHNDSQTAIDPTCQWQFQYAYYYVDDVIVQKTPIQDFEIDLGGPVFACDSFVIDPGFPGAAYEWSDGSHGQTLTVYTTGTYSVTASYACSTYEASIDVDISAGANFDIGPDEVNLCEGEVYSISLDENLGDYEWNDGSNDTEYDISAPGVYAVTLDYGCAQSSDTVEVTVTSPPAPFDLGMDTFFCDGDVILYQFDPTLGDFEWQDHSSASTYVVDNAGTYALSISNECGEESDEIDIEMISPPDFYLGPDSIILCDLEVLDLDFDPEMGAFLWQDGSTNANYTIEQTGLYSLTVSNPCGVMSANIYATHESFPQFDFGPDEMLCPGDTLILTGENSMGEYTWQDGSTASEYIVTTTGTYALTVANDCGFETGDIVISFLPPITPPNLGPDFSLCPGESAVLDIGNNAATHIWNDNSTADTLLVTAAGTYSVHVFNACQSFRDTVVVVLQNNPPTVALPADFSLCQGDTTTLDAGVNNVAYQWNDGTQLSQLTVTSPGWYAITVSNACGADHDSILIGDGGTAPIVSLGIDTSICAGHVFTITPSSSGVNTWTWQDGSTNPFFNVTSPGLVYVDVTNNCGAANDTMLIGLLPAIPPLSLGPDTILCPGESVTFSINIPGVDILWSDGSVGNNLLISDSAVIFAAITNVCGVSADTAEVSLLAGAPSVDLGPDQTICPGETFTISPNVPDVNYLWQDGSTDSTYLVTQQGVISLTISNVCGLDQDTIEIFESTNGPLVDLGPDILACEGETVKIPANISGVSYLWQDGSTANEFVTTVSGTFILTVSNLCGTDKDTIEVVIDGVPPELDLGPDTLLCEGHTFLLKSNTDPTDNVMWQDGSTGPDLLVSLPGTYSLIATNRCGEGRDSVVVKFMKGPDPFELGPDSLICPGQSFVLSAPVTPYEIEWQDGSSQPTIVANDDIVYKLTVRNACGEVSDSLKVNFDQHIPLVHFDAPIPWCPGDQFPLDASQTFLATYLWNTGETTPIIIVNAPGLYAVEVDAMCASTSGETELVQIDDCGPDYDLYVPNVFSPNDDNINDVFTIFTGEDIEVEELHGTIFDRWGNMIFDSHDIPFSWDGRFHDDKMMPGVYVYVLEVKYKVGTAEFERVLSGDVTLIR